MIEVYRAPMRARDDSVPDGPAVERALALRLCGMGGRVEPPPRSLRDALAAVDARFGERAARRLERFASVPDGALVWTRDEDGMMWLGRLAGPWRYDPSGSAREVDLVHVRPCEWLTAPVELAALPAPVGVAFARGGRNWQSIRTAGASTLSAALWDQRYRG